MKRITKIARIDPDDYIFFKQLAPKAKNSKEMFRQVRTIAADGNEFKKITNEITKIGEFMYGKAIWPKITKQKR